MQKNVPKYTPEWVPTITLWAESSKRDVTYALCNDRRTLLWFANQRAVEYHPALVRTDRLDRVTHLILDLDPPEGAGFDAVVGVTKLVRQALGGRRPRGCGQDQRGEGPPRVRADRHGGDDDRRCRRGDASDRRPDRAARPGDRHDGVHQGRSRRQGVRRLDPGRWGDRRRAVQPTRPPRRAGVVPAAVGRPRRHPAIGLHDPHRSRPPRRQRSVGGADAGAATTHRASSSTRATPSR